MVEQVHESGQWVKLNPKYEKYGSKEENQQRAPQLALHPDVQAAFAQRLNPTYVASLF